MQTIVAMANIHVHVTRHSAWLKRGRRRQGAMAAPPTRLCGHCGEREQGDRFSLVDVAKLVTRNLTSYDIISYRQFILLFIINNILNCNCYF